MICSKQGVKGRRNEAKYIKNWWWCDVVVMVIGLMPL